MEAEEGVLVVEVAVVGSESVAVDEEEVGLWGELAYGTVHGRYGGSEDVHLVDFLRGACGYGPCERGIFDDWGEGAALRGC